MNVHCYLSGSYYHYQSISIFILTPNESQTMLIYVVALTDASGKINKKKQSVIISHILSKVQIPDWSFCFPSITLQTFLNKGQHRNHCYCCASVLNHSTHLFPLLVLLFRRFCFISAWFSTCVLSAAVLFSVGHGTLWTQRSVLDSNSVHTQLPTAHPCTHTVHKYKGSNSTCFSVDVCGFIFL